MPNYNPLFVSAPILSITYISATNPILDSLATTLMTWGANANGDVGDNTVIPRRTPVLVSGSIPFSQVSTGTHSIAIRASDGSAWGWGNNGQGQVGDNTSTDRSSPVSIVGAHAFVKITSGVNHGGGIKGSGTAWLWGLNTNGQLGDGTATKKSSPVSVVGAHSFIDLCTGSVHTIAMKPGGDAWTWGANGGGQIGDGSATYRSSPVSVVGAHAFVSVASGGNNNATRGTCAGIKSDGSLWTWGYNTLGTLGDGTSTNRSSPVSVVGAHSFIKIRVGNSCMLAIKADGSSWAWGSNVNGAIGDNTTTNRSSPVSAVGSHSFIDATIFTTAWALKSDGTIWGWGQSNYTGTGILGDGDMLDRSSPVMVMTNAVFTSIGIAKNRTVAALGGPMSLLATAGTNGTRIDYMTIKALGTTTTGVIRIWMDGGTSDSLILYTEVPVTAITASASVAAFEYTITIGQTFPSGTRIWVSTEKGERFNVTLFGGNL